MVAQIAPLFPAASADPLGSRVTPAAQAAQIDAALVRRFNAGDESAFVEIIARHRGKAFAIAYSVLRNRADAEEIAQDTFIKAYRSLARFRGEASLATWLHFIALNLSRNRYWYFCRRHRHETISFEATLGGEGAAEIGNLVTSADPDPARQTANREFSALVELCMGKLGAEQREILALRNFSDHSYKAIAKTLGIGMGTVKSRICRARQDLRGLLVELYDGVDADTAARLAWFETNRPSGVLALACGAA